MAGIGATIALLFGALAGVDAVLLMTAALRIAEGEALRLAIFLSEGVVDPCQRGLAFVVECTRAGESIAIVVDLDGATASATAGPSSRQVVRSK